MKHICQNFAAHIVSSLLVFGIPGSNLALAKSLQADLIPGNVWLGGLTKGKNSLSLSLEKWQEPEKKAGKELKSVTIRFDTTDDDKEATTKVEISIDKPNSSHLANRLIESVSFTPGSSNSFELGVAEKDKKEVLQKCFVIIKIKVGSQEDPWKFDLTIQANYTDGSTSQQLVKRGIALSEKNTKATFSLSDLIP